MDLEAEGKGDGLRIGFVTGGAVDLFATITAECFRRMSLPLLSKTWAQTINPGYGGLNP